MKLKPVSEVVEKTDDTFLLEGVLASDRLATHKAIKEIVEGIHQLYDIEDKPQISKEDLLTQLEELFNKN